MSKPQRRLLVITVTSVEGLLMRSKSLIAKRILRYFDLVIATCRVMIRDLSSLSFSLFNF